MAEKSLVNADAETLGVAPPDEAVLEELVAALVLELDDELPQPATTAATASMGRTARSQRTCIKNLLS
jgi:hypothetical protein